jgi:hypothetical protein
MIVTAICLLAAGGSTVAAAATPAGGGTLAGQTQISYGCPGPVAEGGPSCNPWRTFAGARFTVSPSALGPARTVVSDSLGRFSVRLAPGSYTVAALPQTHTRGGPALHVRIRAGALTRILVRFQGFPMME